MMLNHRRIFRGSNATSKRTMPTPSSMADNVRGTPASSPNTVADPTKPSQVSAAAIAAVHKYQYARHVDQFTSPEQVKHAMQCVSERAASWAALDPATKVELLKDIHRRLTQCGMEIARASTEVKGYGTDGGRQNAAFESRAAASASMAGALTLPLVGAMAAALEQCHAGTTPAVADLPRRSTADGRQVLQVTSPQKPAMPTLRSASAYLYLKPGCEPSQGVERRAAQQAAAEGVCCVLGAGNQAFLGLYDVLHTMFLEGHVACLKYHDAQAKTAPLLEYVLAPLLEGGYLKTFHCDLDLTRHAVYDERVCRVHITGSDRTHDAIAWGTGEEAQRRMAAGEPLLKVPMTSELGNVTPVVVVPGAWTAAEMRAAAKLIAFNMSDNAGCNCLAPKALLLPAEWHQADDFETVLKEELAAVPAAPLWYPGALQLHKQFMQQHSDCELIMPAITPGTDYTAPVVPWAVHHVTLSSAADAAAVPGLAREFFAPVLIMIRLASGAPDSTKVGTVPDSGNPLSSSAAQPPSSPGDDGSHAALAASFLQAVPEFLEHGLWGNLAASVYAPTQVEAAAETELQACLDDLRYGSVILNMPTFFAYLLSEGVWGGFQYPYTSIAKPGSGVGHVSNVYGIDGVEKQVVQAPWGMQLTAPPSSGSD
eukprot:jgi/Ulvmu1/5320/UM022_0114.1